MASVAFESVTKSYDGDADAEGSRRLNAQLVMRLDVSAPRPRVGEVLAPHFPAAKLHLFDAQTGTRLP